MITVTLTRRQTCVVQLPDDVDDVTAAAVAAAADATWADEWDEPTVAAVDDDLHDLDCRCQECEHQAACDQDAYGALCIARGSL